MPVRFLEATADHSGRWGVACFEAVTRIGQATITGVIGPRGTGKTQMAVDIGASAFRARVATLPPERSAYYGVGWEAQMAADKRARDEAVWAARYTTALDMFASIRTRSLEKGETGAIYDWARPDVLVIDEIQERGDTEFEGRCLTNLIDKRYGSMKDTFLIGNLEPTELSAKLGASIVSRMVECGGIIVCDWPSFRQADKATEREV